MIVFVIELHQTEMDRAVFIGAILTTSFTTFSVLTNFAMFCDFHEICKFVGDLWTTSLTTFYIVDEFYIFCRFCWNLLDHLPHYFQFLYNFRKICRFRRIRRFCWGLFRLLINITIFAKFAKFAGFVGAFLTTSLTTFYVVDKFYNFSQRLENLQLLQD